MPWALYAFAVFAGVLSTAFGGSNATLAKTLGQPLTSGILVQLASVVVIAAAGAFYGGLRWPDAGRFAAVPWWAWLGCVGAALILLAQLLVARQIGAAPYSALTVTAAIVTSIVLDQFGWMGFERNPASWSRLAGGLLMIVGVVMVTRN